MGGGAGDGFLDSWYRLGCELPVLYGLVPGADIPVACWGQGSVTWGTAVGGEVGTIWNVDIVPKLVGIDLCWGWWSGVPVGPRIVTGGWGDGSNVVAHVESPDKGSELGICAG